MLKGSTSTVADSMSDDTFRGARMKTERLLLNLPGSTVMSRAIKTFFGTWREFETELSNQREKKVGPSMN